MDEDIRDLFADDYLFDPLAAEDEDAAAGEGLGDADGAEPLIGEAMEEYPAEEPEDDRPASERIADLLASMPGQRRTLLRLIDHCREERSGEEMDAYTEELKRYCFSVFSPVAFRELLQKAGAIDYIPAEPVAGDVAADEAADVPAAGDVASADDVVGGVEAASDASAAASAHTAVGPAPAVLGGQGDPAAALGGQPAPVVVSETYSDGEAEIDIEFLEVTEMDPGTWLATPEGLAVVDAQDDLLQTTELLHKEPEYLPVYARVLDFCADARGRSPKELDAFMNDDPLLQEPRRYAGYFTSRLEKAGAIEWRDGWVTTQAGAMACEEAGVLNG